MLTFQKLWDARPQVVTEDNPCASKGLANFPDQCAIRLGVRLTACSVNTSLLPGVRHCWQHEKSKGHTLSADELAQGLKLRPPGGVRKPVPINPEEFVGALQGRRGIVYFKDFWRRTSADGREESFAGRTGDHIDLWNGYRMSHPGSVARIYFRIGPFGVGSDYRQSKEVWFWEVA